MLPAHISLGCGGGKIFYEESHYSFYPAEKIFPENPYLEFNFSNWIFLEVPEESRHALNIKDWKLFFGENWSDNDIKSLIYKTDLNSIELAISETNSKSTNTKSQKMLLRVKSENQLEFLQYLAFAKKCEPHADFSTLKWGEPKRDSLKMQELITRGKLSVSKNNGPFLQNRYAYQIIRLAHYSRNYSDCISFFDKYWANKSKSGLMYFWSLSLKAGAEKRLMDKNADAAYHFSKVFASNTGRNVQAQRGFQLKTQKEWDAAISLCLNKSEEAEMWFIQALQLHARSLPAMKKVWEYQKDEDKLLHLLGRDIARMEDVLAHNSQYFNFNFKSSYYTELATYLEKEVLSSNLKYKAKWEFSLAYLHFLKNSYSGANTHFAAMHASIKDPTSSESAVLLKQSKLIETIMKYRGQAWTDELESSLVVDLNDFYDHNYMEAYNFLLTLTYNRNYGKRSETFDLLLLGNNPSDYLDLHSNPHKWNFDQLISFYNKPNKTDLETFLLKNFEYSLGDIYYLKGTLEFIEQDLDSALYFLNMGQKAGTKNIRTYYTKADIENFRFRDCHDCDYEDFKGIKKSLIGVIYRIQELENSTRSFATPIDTKIKNTFLLGNIYYNLTHFGNNWYLIDYGHQGTFYRKGANPQPNDVAYADCSIANEYYRKAYNLSINSETKAKALFLMAKCEQNDFYLNENTSEYSWSRDYDSETKFKKYRYNFREFVNEYSGTEFYAKALNECGYLGSYSEKTNSIKTK